MLIDRPAARLARGDGAASRVRPGAPDSFRRGHDPRAFDARRRAERYDAVVATVPNDVFARAARRPSSRGEVGDDYLGRLRSIEYYTALCLLLELDRPFSPLLLDQRGRPDAARSSG